MLPGGPSSRVWPPVGSLPSPRPSATDAATPAIPGACDHRPTSYRRPFVTPGVRLRLVHAAFGTLSTAADLGAACLPRASAAPQHQGSAAEQHLLGMSRVLRLASRWQLLPRARHLRPCLLHEAASCSGRTLLALQACLNVRLLSTAHNHRRLPARPPADCAAPPSCHPDLITTSALAQHKKHCQQQPSVLHRAARCHADTGEGAMPECVFHVAAAGAPTMPGG